MKDKIDFEKNLTQVIGESFSFSLKKDKKNVASSWCRLDNASDIKAVALFMQKIDGRLITITASNIKNDLKEIVYHFDLHGECCNIVVNIDDNKIDSITPILKTADWTERELKELYDVEVIGHPNPQRLFLDETIEEGVMNNYISLSEAMNGASTQTIWEKILNSKDKDNADG
jgi:Ni,Fe-hydrogenase III component G